MKSLPPIRISVLMAVYNTPFEWVKRAIDSVLRQDFQSFELIVLDDGSEPSVGEGIQHYCQEFPLKIKYLQHPNCGQAESINRGVRCSQGPYIAIIDSDDEYKTNHLSACFQEMEEADLICSMTETIVDKEEDYFVPDRYDHTKKIRVDDCTLFATLFGKKEVFESLPFQSMYASDADFYARASALYRVKKLDLRTYIYYRNIPNSLCSNLKNAQEAPV